MIHTIKLSKNPAFALKLDLSKAYDSLNWTFLRLVMIHIGLDIEIVNWVMGCVQTASFVVLINGSSSNFFRASRGLRQGCPLSPFLFLLIVDALSRIINHVKRARSFKGIKITSSLELTHILFIDDVVMLGEGTWENLKETKKILELYKKATGMHINVEKSILSENAILEAITERILA